MMTPCELCKGACCESVIMDLTKNPMIDEWMLARGKPFGTNHVEWEQRCPSLNECGQCSRYDNRPRVCIEYPVGGTHCRETVRRRRPNWQEIFKLMDPMIK